MTGARIEAGVAQAVEQELDAGEAIGGPEFRGEDRAEFGGPEGTDSIGGDRAGVDPLMCRLRAVPRWFVDVARFKQAW